MQDQSSVKCVSFVNGTKLDTEEISHYVKPDAHY